MRYYNSNTISGGILGTGWTASFEGSCKDYNSNSKIVKIYGQAPIVFDLIDGKFVCDYSRTTLNAKENGEIEFIDESGLTYTFNTNGFLTCITDKNGNTITITVDSTGKISRVTDSVGRAYTYAYGDNGLLSSITDCFNRTVSYTYDDFNMLDTVTGVLSTVTNKYDYVAFRLTKVTDAFDKTITEITYTEDGKLSSVTDSSGETTGYAYNNFNNSLTISQNNTVTEQCVYNRYNYLTSANTDEGLQQNYYCNTYGDIAYTVDADYNEIWYGYDNNGNPTKIITITEKDYITELNSYDLNNNLVSTVSDKESTTYTYDSKGNTLSVIKTDDKGTESTGYTYNTNGLVQSVETRDGTVTYTYDNNSYLSSETDDDGNIKTYTYNSIGWLESETDSETTLNYKYNLNGDTLRETKNNVVTSRTVYDNYGRIKQQISEAEYNAEYDGLNTIQQIDTYLNNNNEVAVGVRYYYGDDGSLSQIKSSCYTVNTDSNQKVTSVFAGNTALAEYEYTNDANEKLSKVNYANGQSIEYTYDDSGENVTSVTGGSSLYYTYNYNEDGTLSSKYDMVEHISTSYTDNGYTETKWNIDGGGSAQFHSYNSEKLKKVNGEEFVAVEEGEEADLERITEGFINQAYTTDYYEDLVKYGEIAYSTTKNEDDTVSKTELKNGGSSLVNSAYSYDENNLPTELIQTYNGLKNSYSYTYDDNGNITAIIQNTDYVLGPDELPPVDFENTTVTGSNEKRYYYDNAGQLIRVDDTEADQTIEYVYNDISGNITAVKVYALAEKDAELGTPISTKTFNYAQSGWTDLLTSVDGNPITYDELGNMRTYKGYTYYWGAARRLARITNNTNTYIYTYDDNGIRNKKVINGAETLYATVDGRITGQFDYTNTIYFRCNAENSLLGFNLNGTEYIYLKNLQGDIVGILDQNGNIVVEYTYDAWGKVLSITGTMADTVGVINPMRYRGYYLDAETGYYYLQSRYYDPELCRFINADEPNYIGISGNVLGYNLFAYCENDAVNNVDFTGHSTAVALGSIWAFGGSNFWNPFGWVIIGAATIISCVAIGIRAGKAVSQLKLNKRTKIPSGLKSGKKVKTPASNPGEFTKNKDGTYTHKKTKWKIGKAKDGHYGGEHWHAAPKNAKSGDYYNIGPDGTILS